MELPEMRPPYVQSGSELLTTLDTLQRAISTAQTYRLQLLARLDETGHATDLGARDTTDLISVRHRLNRTDVKRDLTLAKDLTKYPTVTAALPDPYTAPDLDLNLDLDDADPAGPDPDDLDLTVDPEDSDTADADGDAIRGRWC